jgi:hypothetical protein
VVDFISATIGGNVTAGEQTDQLRDLEDLVASPGWNWLVTQVDAEWGAVGFASKVASSIGKPDMTASEAQAAVGKLQQATVAQKAVLQMFDKPLQRIGELRRKTQPAEAASSRRGPGL